MEHEVNLLIDEYPMLVSPTLAKKLGINEAIILQQLHFLSGVAQKSNNNFFDGYYWVYNTYAQWREDHFIWLSEGHIKALFLKLEKDGIIVSKLDTSHPYSHKKWYRINYDILNNHIAETSEMVESQKTERQEEQKICRVEGQKTERQDGRSSDPLGNIDYYIDNNIEYKDFSGLGKPLEKPGDKPIHQITGRKHSGVIGGSGSEDMDGDDNGRTPSSPFEVWLIDFIKSRQSKMNIVGFTDGQRQRMAAPRAVKGASDKYPSLDDMYNKHTELFCKWVSDLLGPQLDKTRLKRDNILSKIIDAYPNFIAIIVKYEKYEKYARYLKASNDSPIIEQIGSTIYYNGVPTVDVTSGTQIFNALPLWEFDGISTNELKEYVNRGV